MKSEDHEPDQAPDRVRDPLDELLATARWPEPSPESLRRLRKRWRSLRKPGPVRIWWPAAAAGVLLVVACAVLVWRSQSRRTGIPGDEQQDMTITEIKRLARCEGMSAQLLAAADLLAAQPGGWHMARERYALITRDYPSTQAATQAAARLTHRRPQ